MPSVGPGRGGKPLTGVDGPMDGWIADAATRDSTSKSGSTSLLGSNLSAVMEMERSHLLVSIYRHYNMKKVGW